MDKRNKRLDEILQILKHKNAESIKRLSEALDVSQMTIRRDIRLLAERNLVESFHGGAIYNEDGAADGHESPDHHYHLPTEGKRRQSEKARIARKAAALIEPDDIIIIDSGSTTERLATFLPSDFPVTVLCYTLNVLVEIYKKPNCTIIFPGGYFHPGTLLFESHDGAELIKRNRANKGFFAAGGVSPGLGVTCSSPYAVPNKRAAIDSSLCRILLADSSKFGKVRAAHYAELSEFTTVITDSGISEEQQDLIRELDIELIIV